MHELGVTFYIIRDVEEAARANNVDSVAEVTIELGEVSGVIHDQLQDCWKWAIKKEHPIVENANLVIETMKAFTFCEDCKQEYPTVEFGKICPHCGSENTYLVRGRDCSIKSIAIFSDEANETTDDNPTADASSEASDKDSE